MAEHVFSLPKKGVSTKIQDYMHLPNFKEVVDNCKSIQDIVQVTPVAVIGFTRQAQVIILKNLVNCAPIDVALRLAKVSEKSFNIWRKLAENNIEPFVSFITECDAAFAMADMEIIQKIRMKPMMAVEHWKLRYPDTILKGQADIQQTVNINFMDLPAQQRAASIRNIVQDIDPSQIVDLPVKDEDD